MARIERKDLDYFPFIAKDGETLFILESKYLCKGTGFFTNVLRRLASTPNHHISIKDETKRMYFFAKTFCDEESGIDMLNIMATTGKINKVLWDEKMVIACNDFLLNAAEAYRNRKGNIIQMSEIFTIYGIDLSKLAQENTQIPLFDEQTSASYTHSKEEYSKEEYSKVKKRILKKQFDKFWNLYQKKVGDKDKLLKKWCALKELDKKLIMEYLPKYILSQPNKKFRKNPETFFNNRSWEDEIIGEEGENKETLTLNN